MDIRAAILSPSPAVVSPFMLAPAPTLGPLDAPAPLLQDEVSARPEASASPRHSAVLAAGLSLLALTGAAAAADAPPPPAPHATVSAPTMRVDPLRGVTEFDREFKIGAGQAGDPGWYISGGTRSYDGNDPMRGPLPASDIHVGIGFHF